jgi:hypothetical protein
MLSPFLSVPHPCEEAVIWLQRRLARNGLRALRTFDLQDARLSLEDCPCPHHGTDQCDCQLVVLLVYGKASEPVTLILHGYDGQTWISLADRAGQATDASTVATIQSAVDGKKPASARSSA